MYKSWRKLHLGFDNLFELDAACRLIEIWLIRGKTLKPQDFQSAWKRWFKFSSYRKRGDVTVGKIGYWGRVYERAKNKMYFVVSLISKGTYVSNFHLIVCLSPRNQLSCETFIKDRCKSNFLSEVYVPLMCQPYNQETD